MFVFMRRFTTAFVILVALGLGGYVFVTYYGLIFAHVVAGKVIGVERVSDPGAIVNTAGTNGLGPSILYSFAIAIQSATGEILTGSSEDRQWAVVHRGQCAEAKFLPYPPWDLMKSNTYHSVRLLRLFNCPGESAAELTTPAPTE